MDFQILIAEAGLNIDTLSNTIKISRRTIKKWIDEDQPPTAVFLYLSLRAKKMEAFDPAWSGWSIDDGILWTPEGTGYSPGDVRSIWFLRQLSEVIERRSARKRFLPFKITHFDNAC